MPCVDCKFCFVTSGGIVGFRLPTPSRGMVFIDNEIGHLFNVDGINTDNRSPFRFVASLSWSSTVGLLPMSARTFECECGTVGIDEWDAASFVWAVHDGDVGLPPPPQVPEPSTMLPLGSGLVEMLGWRHLRRG